MRAAGVGACAGGRARPSRRAPPPPPSVCPCDAACRHPGLVAAPVARAVASAPVVPRTKDHPGATRRGRCHRRRRQRAAAVAAAASVCVAPPPTAGTYAATPVRPRRLPRTPSADTSCARPPTTAVAGRRPACGCARTRGRHLAGAALAAACRHGTGVAVPYVLERRPRGARFAPPSRATRRAASNTLLHALVCPHRQPPPIQRIEGFGISNVGRWRGSRTRFCHVKPLTHI